jgi:hypothetical protein
MMTENTGNQRHAFALIEINEGRATFKVSGRTKIEIWDLLEKQNNGVITPEEEQELEFYDKLNDYLTLINVTVQSLPPMG